MTIKIFARPRFHFVSRDDWTEVSVEGDTEEAIANIITSQLLATGHEVKQLGEEDAEPVPFGEYDE